MTKNDKNEALVALYMEAAKALEAMADVLDMVNKQRDEAIAAKEKAETRLAEIHRINVESEVLWLIDIYDSRGRDRERAEAARDAAQQRAEKAEAALREMVGMAGKGLTVINGDHERCGTLGNIVSRIIEKHGVKL